MAVLLGHKLAGKPWLISAGIVGGGVPATGGTPGTMSVNSSIADYRRVFQRDAASGNPTGFSTPYNKGWGAVTFQIAAANASSGLFCQLYDADSAGASASTPGTGTLLNPSVQIASNVPQNTNANSPTQVVADIPAGPAYYYIDLALDGAMTNPVRIARPIGMGVLVTGMSRSFWSCLANQWEFFGTTQPGNYCDLSQIVSVGPAAGSMINAADNRYPPNGPGSGSATWVMPGNAANDGNGNYYATSAGMEFLRLMNSQLGVVCGVCGVFSTGGDMEVWNTNGGGWFTFSHYMMPYTGSTPYKFRYFLLGANGGGYGKGHWRRTLNNIYNAVQALSSIPVIFCYDGMGWWTGGASAPTGYGGINVALSKELESQHPSNAIALDRFDANRWWNGHSTMRSRVRMARNLFRAFMAAETDQNGGFGGGKGPSLTSGSRASGSYTLRVGFQHDGGSVLGGYGWAEPYQTSAAQDPGTTITNSPVPEDYLPAIAVYPAGENGGTSPNGEVALDLTNTVAIDNVNNQITILLDSTAGAGLYKYYNGVTAPLTDSTAFDVYYGVDYYGASTISGLAGALLCDDRVDVVNGIPYGWGMRATTTPIFIPAPSNSAQAVAINTPLTQVAGGLMKLSGPSGAGTPASTLQVAVNGGTKQTPLGLMIWNDNSWEGWVPAPGQGAGNKVAVYRPGQASPSATSGAFATATRSVLLGSGPDASYAGLSAAAVSSLVASYVAPNFVWQDTAATVAPTGDIGSLPSQVTQAWGDETGNAANLLTTYQNPPALEFRTYDDRAGITCEPYTGLGTASGLSTSLTGDFTILCALRQIANDWTIWALGSTIAMTMDWNSNLIFKRGSNGVTVSSSVLNLAGNYRKVLVRYQASTGLLEAFSPAGSIGSSTSNQGEAITPGPLTITPYWGPVYGMMLFSSRFTDADTTALLTWATATWG